MENELLVNFMLFLGICVLLYLIFSTMNKREGLQQNDASNNGVAGNATTYASNVKNITTQLQDTLLISKYRTDYENVITDMDDLVDNLMLETVLSMDMKTPDKSLEKLNALNASKVALSNVLKFVDKS
mgnify:CR=1 FL=1|tara:strand:+ start:343 stop:726 length:384 start_codon:yes stop_codon:yes gene_type:complete